MLFFAVFVYATAATLSGSVTLDHPAVAQTDGNVPGNTLGNSSRAQMWRDVRRGRLGLVQSEGNNWRAVRNGPVSVIGGWTLFGTLVALAAFFVLRGRIRIDSGPSGKTVTRFTGLERFSHWLVANCFILLALTGLNTLYGRYFLKPLLGADAFSTLTITGKYIHNYVAFAFILGLILILVLWVRHNLPDRHDVVWLLKAGGLFTKGVHPPARKFNAGQKILFWIVVLGGASISVSGLALLFPFQFDLFAATFAFLNLFGADLPTSVTALQEMQLSQLWHSVLGLALIAVILAHIYIGSIGMEGAFDAMGTGEVDENWAREHHPLWVEEQKNAADAGGDLASGNASGDD